MASSMAKAAADFHALLDSKLFRVIVGYPGKTYHIPKALLCTRGGRYLGKLAARGLESVDLPINDLNNVNLFVFWVYQESLPTWTWSGDVEANGLLVREMCNAWIMGAKLGIPAFQNCIMDNLCDAISMSVRCVSPELMQHVYVDTDPGSALRRLVADALAVRLNLYDESIDDWKELHTMDGFAADLHRADRWYWEHRDQRSRYARGHDGGDRNVYMMLESL